MARPEFTAREMKRDPHLLYYVKKEDPLVERKQSKPAAS
jgi:hypothetical protein